MKKFRIFGFLAILVFMFSACFGGKSEKLTGVYKEVDDLLKEIKAEVTNKDKFFAETVKGIENLKEEEARMIKATFEILKVSFDTVDYKIENVVEEGDNVIATLKIKSPKSLDALVEITTESMIKKDENEIKKLETDMDTQMDFVEETFGVLAKKIKDGKIEYSDETIELNIKRKDGKLDGNSLDVRTLLNTVTGLGTDGFFPAIGM